MEKKKSVVSALTTLIILFIFLFNTFPVGAFAYKKVVYRSSAYSCEDLNEDDEIATYSTKQYDTFLEAYYENLKNHFGRNIKGSCGYVAIGMLLSYYDTYLNDNIIPEICDEPCINNDGINMNSKENSPGILFDDVTQEELSEYNNKPAAQLTASEYYEIMVKKANAEEPSFHAKLITLGKELGYYNFNNNDYPCETNFGQLKNLLKTYFKKLTGFKEGTDFDIVTETSSESIRDFIIRNIKDCNPVMVGMNGESKKGEVEGHEFIAYAYDETNDIIYGNMGGNKRTTHENIEEKYKTFEDALVLNFHIGHTHTNNYKYNGTEYCYCDHRIITYKQTPHTYTDHYSINLDGTHTAYCNCGESVTSEHSYNYASVDANWHTLNCECGVFKQKEKHLWVAYVPPLTLGTSLDKQEQLAEPNGLGGREYVQCYHCHFVRKLLPGEIIEVPIL